MKRFFSSLLFIALFLLIFSQILTYGVEPSYQVTWTSGKAGICRVDGPMKKSTVPTITDYIPSFTSDKYPDYYYNFIGWYFDPQPTYDEYLAYKEQNPDDKSGYRAYCQHLALIYSEEYLLDPVWPKGVPFPEFKPQPITKDTVYYAYYDKVPKAFSLNGDTFVDISDVTALLDYLSDSTSPLSGSGDINNDHRVNIMDVTRLLNYLSFGV